MRSDIKKHKSKKRSRRSGTGPTPDDYQMVLIWSHEDDCYVVTLPAWQNAQTHGATPEEAVRNAREVLTLLIATATKHGELIPQPERRHSGNLRLRLPASLHGRLAREAEREGVSLNQLIVSKLAS
jgi:predicted RNase H-like HicB family nuclease